MSLKLGDCRIVMPRFGKVDVVIADPDYGTTPALKWGRYADGWLKLAADTLKPTGSLWCFGSFRFFMSNLQDFTCAGLEHVQEIVWEKQAGSSWQADRFKRVHEFAVQFKLASSLWRDVYKNPVMTFDAKARTVKRKANSKHLGKFVQHPDHVYKSEDGGPRLMRSIVKVRNCNGYAEHPTQKPEDIVKPLIQYSCPPEGVVGDWFAGSGTVGVVCKRLGVKYVGVELNKEYYDIASRRIRGTRIR